MEQKNELDQCLKRFRLRDEISLLLSITKAEEEAVQDQDEDATRSVRKLPYLPVWPDLAIFCTLGNHSKLVATIILPKSPTLLANFCIGVKIIHFSSEFTFGQFYRHLAIFIWSHWFLQLYLLKLNMSISHIWRASFFREQTLCAASV